jgi:hypothetical protein
MRGAREKHPVSTVSLCIKNKPSPQGTRIFAHRGLQNRRVSLKIVSGM